MTFFTGPLIKEWLEYKQLTTLKIRRSRNLIDAYKIITGKTLDNISKWQSGIEERRSRALVEAYWIITGKEMQP